MKEPEDIKLEDIISQLKSGEPLDMVESEDQDWYQDLERKSKKAATMEDKENDGILSMRKSWSYLVLFLIVAIVFFDMYLVYAYGSGKWDFEDPVVVIVVITDNFLKIFGLGFLITREIFRKIFR